MFFKRKLNKNINFLELTPIRNVDFEIEENSIVKLLIPRFKNKFAQEHLIPKFRSKFIKANLDKFGSSCFELIDGEKNVLEISNSVKEKHGEIVEPVYERVSKFFGYLYRFGLVRFKEIN